MKFLSTLALLICLANPSSSQNEIHTPHGGQLKNVGNYRMEVVDCSGYLEIYLYDLNLSPVRNVGLDAQVDFHYPNGSCITVQAYRYGNDCFTAEPEQPSYTSCEVFIRGKGIFLRAVFDDLVCRKPDE